MALRGSRSLKTVILDGTLKLARRSPTMTGVERRRASRRRSSRITFCGELLPETFVGDAVHRRLVHGRVLIDRRLDLGAVHVLAGSDDHVLGPVLDVHETLVIDATDVARPQPSVDQGGCCRVGSVPIPADTFGPRKTISPRVAGRQQRAGVIDYTQLEDWRRPAGAGRGDDVVVAGVLRSVRVGLGHPVPDEGWPGANLVRTASRARAAPEHLRPLPNEATTCRGRRNRATRADPSHRRHADEVRDRLALDQLERAVGSHLYIMTTSCPRENAEHQSGCNRSRGTRGRRG